MRWNALLLALAACNDAPPGARDDPDGTTALSGWCAVEATFRADCLVCHSASAKLGGLDLETDPHATLVNQPSIGYAATLVVPGDPAGSLLYLKVSGEVAGDLGDIMPPSGDLAASAVEAIRSWIADGADDDCVTDPTVPPNSYHPDGYLSAAVHGLEAKFQVQVCTQCHGLDLTGGAVQRSCDTCHFEATNDWRTHCTFCHGGANDDPSGAPPENIDDSLAPVVFEPHQTHVNTDLRAQLDCTECHAKPVDIFSVGHLFVGDATPGVGEVAFLGVSLGGTWDPAGSGSCSVYCHGAGLAPATVLIGSGPKGCADCHPSMKSSPADWNAMSGRHRVHLEDVGADCASCHPTTRDNTTIADGSLHLDGDPDVTVIGGTVDWNGATCSGLCHSKDHAACTWTTCP